MRKQQNEKDLEGPEPRQKTFETLSLQDTKRMLAAGEAKANKSASYNIAVVDAGGHLLAFSRQDAAPDRQDAP